SCSSSQAAHLQDLNLESSFYCGLELRARLRPIGLVMTTSTPSKRVRFGVFEVDLRSGELHKHGVKIKLHHQPFQVLAILLERPGDVVTREELKSKLWPFDTFVDFDVGLNSAVKKLRDALGDSAEIPRYVETLS